MTEGMLQYAVLDAAGNILRTGTCQKQDLALQARAGQSAVEAPQGIDDSSTWYDGTAFVEKQEMPIQQDVQSIVADGVAVCTFTGVPAGTTVDGAVIDDGLLEFSTNDPGEHKLLFVKRPEYKDATFSVEAV